MITMNPAEFLLDLANGNLNDISVPSELEDKVQTENSNSETRNEKPTPAIVHEVMYPFLQACFDINIDHQADHAFL